MSSRHSKPLKMSVIVPPSRTEEPFENQGPSAASFRAKSIRLPATRARQGQRIENVMMGPSHRRLTDSMRSGQARPDQRSKHESGNSSRAKRMRTREPSGTLGLSSSAGKSPAMPGTKEPFSRSSSVKRALDSTFGTPVDSVFKKRARSESISELDAVVIDVDALPLNKTSDNDDSLVDKSDESATDEEFDSLVTPRRAAFQASPLQLRGISSRMKSRAREDGGEPPPRKKAAVFRETAENSNRTGLVLSSGRTKSGYALPYSAPKNTSEVISTGSFYGTERVRSGRPFLDLQLGSLTRPSKPLSRLSLTKRRAEIAEAGQLRPPARDFSALKSSCASDERLRDLNSNERALVYDITHGVSKNAVVSEIKNANIILRGSDIVRLRGRRWLNDELINAFAALVNARNTNHFRLHDAKHGEALQKSRDWTEEIGDDECSVVEPERVRSGRPRTYMFNSFFYTRLSANGYDYDGVRRWTTRAKVDVLTLDQILFPVNLDNFHWVLAAIDLKHREFLYFDSMYRDDPMYHSDTAGVLSALRRWLVDEVTNKHGEPAMRSLDIERWKDIDRPSYLPKQNDNGSCGVFTLYMADYLELGKTPDFEQEHIAILRQRTVLYLKNARLPEC